MSVTFLRSNQIWGNYALSVIKQYGIATSPSDLAMIMGAEVFPESKNIEFNASTTWWTVSPSEIRNPICVFGEHKAYANSAKACLVGRPALPPSVTSQIPENQVRFTRKVNGAQIVEYGEYPQTAVNPQMSENLTNMLNRNQLCPTGKEYTLGNNNMDTYYDSVQKFINHGEFMDIDGTNRYIRVKAQLVAVDTFMRNGISVQTNNQYWVRVEPIEWLADPTGWWVAKDGLFTSARFNDVVPYYGDFENTEISAYLNNYFAKQMLVRDNHDRLIAYNKVWHMFDDKER